MRLIDAKALFDALYDADAITMHGAKIISQFPAVSVVRCKDCKHWEQFPYSRTTDMRCSCREIWVSTEANHFCSYGEKRDENENLS